MILTKARAIVFDSLPSGWHIHLNYEGPLLIARFD